MAEPVDVEALQRQIADLQAQLAKAQQSNVAVSGDNAGSINTGTRIATQGGAVVGGSVEAGGHFIGRDFVQTITTVVHQGEDPEEAKSVIAHYLDALARDLAGLKLGEIDATIDQSRQQPLQLADVYVPLDTTLRIPQDTTLSEWLSPYRKTPTGSSQAREGSRPVSALEALAEHRELTLLGKPGSGKSTFGAWALLALTQTWQGHSAELARLGDTWVHCPLLPIRIILRRFAEQLPAGDKPACVGDLWAFIARDLEESGYGLSTKVLDYIQRIARKTGALFLLDGLDECGDSMRRERVRGAVKGLMCSAGKECRFLLTARPYAWPEGPNPQLGVYALTDLEDDQIGQFIQAWYSALVRRGWNSPGEADRKRQDLLNARHRTDLRPLGSNPLLLTLMVILHTNKGRLPDDRTDLYNESVELLMLRWNRQIGADKALLDELNIPGLKLSDLRAILEELAFQVHGRNVAREGTADIGEDRLVRAFCALLHSKDKADVVVNYIEKRAGLLIGQGEKEGERQFSFPHRTFQEFLAACHLASLGDFPVECARLARTAPEHWQVVLPLAARLAKAERGCSAADELIGSQSVEEASVERPLAAADWNSAFLAGLQLQELGRGAIGKSERTRKITQRMTGWLAASLPLHPNQGGMTARSRAQAGDVLAALGDSRFDPQRFYLPVEADLGFVHIPADAEFCIGTRKADALRMKQLLGFEAFDNEINDLPTPSPEFYVARYPTTVAQFRAFVEITGIEIGDPDALRDPDNRPVRWVSWHEALVYCEWLNEALRTSPALESSEISRLVRSGRCRVELPSELEWEKAARGGLVGGIYPWGDEPDPERANYSESQIGDTSAVGCFPANGYGLYDMSGNVFEWTRSLWGTDMFKRDSCYPYNPVESDQENLRASDDMLRVVPGGSWNRDRVSARCAYRLRNRPDARLISLGFRVVLRVAPIASL